MSIGWEFLGQNEGVPSSAANGSEQFDEAAFDKRLVLRDSLAVAIPVGTYGAAFGAAAVGSGFSVLQSCFVDGVDASVFGGIEIGRAHV